jgi:phosphatidate cytidylyltransferase
MTSYFTHTETETDDQDVALLVAKQKAALQAVKKKGSDAGKSQVKKRIIVAFFLLSWFLLPVYLGYPFVVAYVASIGFFFFRESSQVGRDPKKDRAVPELMGWVIFAAFHLVWAPKFFLTKAVLEHSGLPKDEYPWLHQILFEYNTHICFVVLIAILLWFIVSLRRGALRYQFSRLGHYVITGSVLALHNVAGFTLYQMGVFWVVFVPITIGCNDCMAYFCGKTFGRTPLITLSPNKTLEGFLGGAFFTCIFVSLLCGTIFTYESLTCINYNLAVLPFAGPVCANPQSREVFERVFITSPFGDVSDALATCITFALFASLASPFAGFLASGIKRAYKIKDFSNIIPGHGGFLDRGDCTIFADLFMLYFLTQMLNREYLLMDEVVARSHEMGTEDR